MHCACPLIVQDTHHSMAQRKQNQKRSLNGTNHGVRLKSCAVIIEPVSDLGVPEMQGIDLCSVPLVRKQADNTADSLPVIAYH
jgi:hypothetical protein